VTARLHHVAIPRPPDTEAAARSLYCDLLGLTEMTPPTALDSLQVIWFQLDGGGELHLFVEEPMGQDRSGRHFCLAVDDMEKLRQRLVDAGVSVVGDAPIPGRPRYFVRDPFGNLIELTTIEA